MVNNYYAKSVLFNGRHPTVKEHLEGVLKLAREYGAEVSMAEAAELAGMLHDFGKYSNRFQDLLKRKATGVNHAICGAALLYRLSNGRPGFHKIIEVISAHHSALTGYASLKNYLDAVLRQLDPIEFDGKESALSGIEEYQAATELFRRDFPDFRLTKEQMLKLPTPGKYPEIDNLNSMLRSRMLLSCLVDADYSTSAMEEDESFLARSEQSAPDFSAALLALAGYRAELSAKSEPDTELNQLRSAVFEACSAAAAQEPGLYNLTAPTGTGKTLALLQFALRHCVQWKKTRIILVLPFLSLTEQSARVYRTVLPELLEDTSQSRLDDDARLYSDRWRVPAIITTSVKFFESLFADRPGDCRRLHNIANSVIVFDESQTLPPELTRFTIHAARELTRSYGCTMLFSTATQPDFSAIHTLEEWAPREILPNHADFYAALKRTTVTWRIGDGDRIGWEELAQELSAYQSVCAIVNVRKHARALYRAVLALCGAAEVFFLTTDLCPAHRSQVIAAIRARLDAHLPCRVISTQCIEAGVDLDFDAVYRALAPLDSIIQAAGRCNRNGRLPGPGQVVVFWPEDEAYPGDWYRNAAKTVQRLCKAHPIDIHDPAEIQRYYREVFSGLKDKPALKDAIERQDYRAVAREYRMIERRASAQVIVPYHGEQALYDEIISKLARGITPDIMRQAAPLTVSCYAGEKLAEVAEQIPFRKHDFGMSPFYRIRVQSTGCYDPDMGFQIPDQPKNDFIY